MRWGYDAMPKLQGRSVSLRRFVRQRGRIMSGKQDWLTSPFGFKRRQAGGQMRNWPSPLMSGRIDWFDFHYTFWGERTIAWIENQINNKTVRRQQSASKFQSEKTDTSLDYDNWAVALSCWRPSDRSPLIKPGGSELEWRRATEGR